MNEIGKKKEMDNPMLDFDVMDAEAATVTEQYAHEAGKDDPAVLFGEGSLLHNLPKHLMCLFSPHEIELLQLVSNLSPPELRNLVDNLKVTGFSPLEMELRESVRTITDAADPVTPTPFRQALVAVCRIKFMTDNTVTADVRIVRKLAVHMNHILENMVEDVRRALGKLENGGSTLADCDVTAVNFFSSGSEKTVPSIKISITVGYAQPGEIEAASRGELMGEHKGDTVIDVKTIN